MEGEERRKERGGRKGGSKDEDVVAILLQTAAADWPRTRRWPLRTELPPLGRGRSTRFPPRSSPSSLVSPSLSLSLLPVVPPPPPSAPVVSVGRGPPDVVSRMHAVGRVGRGAVPPSYRRRRRGDSTYTRTPSLWAQ